MCYFVEGEYLFMLPFVLYEVERTLLLKETFFLLATPGYSPTYLVIVFHVIRIVEFSATLPGFRSKLNSISSSLVMGKTFFHSF